MVENKEDGWTEWLREYGLAYGNLEEDAAYRRYLLFKDVKFGIVPRQKPFTFPPKEREWLRSYMESQCKLGVFCYIIRGVD